MMCLTWFQLKEDMVAPLTTSIFITRHAALNAIAGICQTICVVTSSNVLGGLVQYEQKGLDRGRWVGIYTQRMKIVWLCLGSAIKIS